MDSPGDTACKPGYQLYLKQFWCLCLEVKRTKPTLLSGIDIPGKLQAQTLCKTRLYVCGSMLFLNVPPTFSLLQAGVCGDACQIIPCQNSCMGVDKKSIRKGCRDGSTRKGPCWFPAEDQNWGPSTHFRLFTTACNPSFKESGILLWSDWESALTRKTHT